MISIVHLITTLDVGGAEATLVGLASHLDRTRFACTVVSIAGPGALMPQLRAAGIEVHTLSRGRSIGPGGVWKLAALLRRIRPALVQTWLYHADLLGLLAGRAAGVPAIAWNIRCSDLDWEHHSRLLPWIRSSLAHLSRFPDVVVVNSEAGREVHERIGYRPRRWALIPNGLDTNVFVPSEEHRTAVRKQLGIPECVPIVALIARYHPMKDHATFLAAMRHVAAAHPTLRVLLAGRGLDPSNGTLQRMIAEHELHDRVVLVGETHRPARLLASADVTVSSSYGEGFPNIVAESMACGVPVVVTDVGDSARIVGSTGRVVPARDPAALATAVGAVLARPRSERVALGLAARQRIVENFSLDAAVSRYEALYLDLVTRSGGRH